MKKILIFIFLLFASIGTGQKLSPLVAPINTNSIIDRPELFKKIQSSLTKDLENVPIGLRVDFLDKYLDKYKTIFFSNLEAIKVVRDEKTNVITFKIFTDATLTFDPMSETDTLTKLINNLRTKVNNEYISKIINTSLKPLDDKIKITILQTLFSLLKGSDLAKGMEEIPGINLQAQDNSIEGLKNNLSTLISNILIDNLKNKLIQYLNKDGKGEVYDKPLSKLLNQDPELIKKFVDNTNEYLNNIFATVTNGLKQIYQDTETKLKLALKEVDNFLVSGNIGMSISEGSGDFNSGLQISWNFANRTQLGVYLNGQLNKSDSTLPKSSLVALQGRWLLPKVLGIPKDIMEWDLIGSAYFGDNNFSGFKYYEYGGSITFNIKQVFILGASYFQLGNMGIGDPSTFIKASRTLGFTFRSTNKNFPSVFLGYSWQKDTKGKFGFEVITPINGN